MAALRTRLAILRPCPATGGPEALSVGFSGRIRVRPLRARADINRITVTLAAITMVYVAFATLVLRPWMQRVAGGTIPRAPGWLAGLIILVSALLGEAAGRPTRSLPVGFAGFGAALSALSAAALYIRVRKKSRETGPLRDE